jgi:hypothetical protein
LWAILAAICWCGIGLFLGLEVWRTLWFLQWWLTRWLSFGLGGTDLAVYALFEDSSENFVH